MVSLDGSTRYVGTEFIKLLNTGSSNLATEQFVNDAVSGGGSGGDLSNYYNQTEVDNLLNAKLNISNPQDVSGTLRLGHIDGTSKIILNAVGSNGKDFYVNGDSQILGNLTVLSLDSTGYINANNIQTNTYNALNTNDIFFQSNSVSYAQYDASENLFRFINDVRFTNIKGNFISNYDSDTDLKLQINSNDFITLNATGNKIEIDRDVEMHSSVLKSNTLDTWTDADLEIKRNGANFLELKTDNRIIANQVLQCGDNLTTQEIDTIANLDLVIKRNGVDFITLADGQINFNQPTNLATGGDTSNCVKKTGETDQRVDGSVSINGDAVDGYELTVAGQVHSQGMFLASNTNLIFGNATRYITNPPTSNNIRHYTNGEHQFYCNGLEDFLIDQDKALARGNMLCVGQFQGSVFNSFNNNTVDVSFRKANVELMKLGGAKVMAYFPLGVASNIYDSVDNADVIFKRNFVDFFYLRNNTVDLNAGISLASDGISCNELSSKSGSDLTFQRAGTNVIKFNANSQIEFMGGSSKTLMYEILEQTDTLNVFRIWNTDSVLTSGIIFGVGLTAEIMALWSDRIRCAVPINCNTISTDGTNDLTIQRAGVEKMKIYDTYVDFADDIALKLNKKAYFNVEIGKDVYMNCFTESNVRVLALYNQDQVGQVRIGVDDNPAVIGLSKSTITLAGDLVSASGKGITTDEVFTNIYDTRYNTGDVAWQYNNLAYMYYDASENTFKFGVNVILESNSDLTCDVLNYNTLNQTSDKRAKEQIEDVETDCVDIVKKVPVRKFYMKDDKKKRHNIGFIAQEILEAIPNDFENVVNKNKDGLLGMDYTKCSVILWKCCQEQQSKIEHLEASVYELQEAMKELKGKGKAKAKPKSKKSNID